MTKLRNRLVLILLALCLGICSGLFVACGGDTPDNSSVTYTVTVKAGASAAASGVKVTIKKGGAIIGRPATTDNNGKAEFKLAEDDYTVELSNLPDGYELPADATLTFAPNHTLLVALTESFAYKVSLVTPDGEPYYAENVTVGVCTLSGNCLNPELLGTDGKVRIVQPKSNYHVKVEGLPANAAVQCDADGYAMYTDANKNYTHVLFTETETETKITVYPVTEIGSGDAMTAQQKTEFAAGHKDYIAAYQKLTAYKYGGTLAEGESDYYAIVPEYSGEYLLFKDSKASYLYQDTEFELGNKGTGVYSSLVLKAYNRYIIHVSNTGSSEINYEFVVAYPAASLTQMTAVGTTSVVINDASKAAVIEFSPKTSAAYKATVQGDGIAAIKVAEKSSTAQDTVFAAADYKAGSEISFKFTEDMIGEIMCLAVGVKSDATVPATLRVKIEKLNDLTNTTTQKQPAAALTPYADQQGTLTPIALTASENEKIVKDGDVYRYGTDGPIVVVSLTGILDERCAVFTMDANDREVRGQLVYLETITGSRVAPYKFLTSSAADLADLSKGKAFDDYRVMLRGFAEYNVEANNQGGFTLNIPKTGLAENYYAKNVNKDGVYPLTDELKAYLQKVASDYPNVIDNSASPDAAWLFACYYYAE